MSVNWNIPPGSRFYNTLNTFTGTFNVPTVGVYDFGVAANVNQLVLRLEKNAVYLIERMSVGGDISEESFNDSINTVPVLTLRRSQSNVIVYQEPLRIANYIDAADVAAFVVSDKGNDTLVATFTGVLNQVAATVGRATIAINIMFGLYIVDSNWYSAQFRRKGGA